MRDCQKDHREKFEWKENLGWKEYQKVKILQKELEQKLDQDGRMYSTKVSCLHFKVKFSKISEYTTNIGHILIQISA